MKRFVRHAITVFRVILSMVVIASAMVLAGAALTVVGEERESARMRLVRLGMHDVRITGGTHRGVCMPEFDATEFEAYDRTDRFVDGVLCMLDDEAYIAEES